MFVCCVTRSVGYIPNLKICQTIHGLIISVEKATCHKNTSIIYIWKKYGMYYLELFGLIIWNC